MSLKILVIQGSGRPKGNTAQLIDSFKAGCEESWHSVEVINLIRNEVRGCTGCDACRFGKTLRTEGRFQQSGTEDFGGGLSGVCHAAVFLAGGCGDTSGKPEIDKTGHLQEAWKFGKNLYGGDGYAEM